MITFVHTADWQIGKPFASIADPAKRARVQQERIEAVRRIGRVVRERRASFVVVAGDLFDSPTPTHATIAAALGAIASLEVPVYCIPGNHDHGGPDSLWEQTFFRSEHRRLAANVHLLLEPEPVIVDLPESAAGPSADGGPPGVVLLPCPLRRRHEADDPTAWIRSLDMASFGPRPRIMIAHGSTTVFTAGGKACTQGSGDGARDDHADDDEPAATSINTLALDRLPLAELDYLALGDWHGFLAVGPKAVYSGTPEIDRFPKPGQRPGHVAVVAVARAAEPRVEPVATGRLRWLAHSVTLGSAASCDAGRPGSLPQKDTTSRADPASRTGRDTGFPTDEATVPQTMDEPQAMDDGPGAVASLQAGEGPMQLDDWLTAATRPAVSGEAGFDVCLARLEVRGSISLAERADLDRIVESWTARLLRFDLDDQTVLAPAPDEIRQLAERPGDPIIARVAAELMALLDHGSRHPGDESAPGPEVIRHAIHILHALVTGAAAADDTAAPARTFPVGTLSADVAGATT